MQIRVLAEAGETPAIFVGRGCEVNIHLKGENVLTSEKAAGLYISSLGVVRIFRHYKDEGSLYVASTGDAPDISVGREILSGTTLDAVWKANNYVIRYYANDGTGDYVESTETYDVEAALRKNEFIRTGYSFEGWATVPDGEIVYADEQTMKNLVESGILNLYAVWKADVYILTYHLDGGTVSPENPATYTIETETFTLTNPTKTGYLFAGWTEEGGTGEPVMTVTIPKGSAGNRIYTAHWTEIIIIVLPDTFEMFTGESVTWDPNPDGGTWEWDSSFFSAEFNSPATFTALKPGTSVISYTVNGVTHNVSVTIKKPAPPYTGNDDIWTWLLMSVALICGMRTALLVKRRKTASKKTR